MTTDAADKHDLPWKPLFYLSLFSVAPLTDTIMNYATALRISHSQEYSFVLRYFLLSYILTYLSTSGAFIFFITVFPLKSLSIYHRAAKSFLFSFTTDTYWRKWNYPGTYWQSNAANITDTNQNNNNNNWSRSTNMPCALHSQRLVCAWKRYSTICAPSFCHVVTSSVAIGCCWFARARAHGGVETCQNSFFNIKENCSFNNNCEIVLSPAEKSHYSFFFLLRMKKKSMRILVEKSELTNDGIRSDSGSVGRFELLSEKWPLL